MTSDHTSGPNEPNDLDLSSFIDDAALVRRVQASYATLPTADAAQVARCTVAVLAQGMHAPSRRFSGSLRPRWWWGAAAAALLVVSVSTVALRRDASRLVPTASPPRPAQPVGSTSEQGDATRFDLTLPSAAREVALVGDFNGWDEHATPMLRRPDSGAWSAHVALAPGRHVYAFVIDGKKWLVDPLAPQVPDDGFGPANAVVVDGPQ